ncbi:hypothetical protein QFZ37_003613 [Chryseobacterium ginsenosidimutans]|uniref:DUF6268 family outer membrane beta-barrel protein n=1 Tax=Chryseobacterium ginsenosidimutans TaxID=687846 RepID=UPI0027839D65|nr:DUF6268 family outer membrane beta-barrel protein [Chryseobacterium ginsenosidimutans]MDQ0595244.1 hypothetical protein [Chryseobacterium ginsenosidimutans]
MDKKIMCTLKLWGLKVMVIILLIPFCIYGQESTEFFSASYSVASRSRAVNVGNVRVGTVDINLITPTINIGKNLKLNNIFAYKSSNYAVRSEEGNAISYPGNLSDLQYALLMRQQLNKRWSLIALPQLIVRSNFKSNFGSRDFFPALAVIAMNQSANHKGLQWGYGGSYSRDFTKNTFTPLFAVSYSSSDYRVDIMLPVKAQFVMTPSKILEYGIDANLETAIYNIGTKNDYGAQYTKTINIPVALTGAVKIKGMVWIKAKVGMNFAREYEFLDSSFKALDGRSHNIESSPYASIGISLRIKE